MDIIKTRKGFECTTCGCYIPKGSLSLRTYHDGGTHVFRRYRCLQCSLEVLGNLFETITGSSTYITELKRSQDALQKQEPKGGTHGTKS